MVEEGSVRCIVPSLTFWSMSWSGPSWELSNTLTTAASPSFSLARHANSLAVCSWSEPGEAEMPKMISS